MFFGCVQLTATAKDAMEDGAMDFADGTLEEVEEEAEAALEFTAADMAVLGAGGAVAGMAIYKGAQALRTQNNDLQEDVCVASMKWKLSVCFSFGSRSRSLSLLRDASQHGLSF